MEKGGDSVSDDYSRESMLDMYIFETLELIEQLEQLILYCEENKNYNEDTSMKFLELCIL